MALGAIVVLTTSTLNRLMVVELALPAVLPGAARRAALRHPDDPAALGLRLRPRRPAHPLDRRRHGGAGRSARWAPRSAILVLETSFWPGLMLSVAAYALIGLGVGAVGHLAAGADRHRHRAAPARRGRDHHLADDDLRHRGDRRHLRRLPRPLHATPRCCGSSRRRHRRRAAHDAPRHLGHRGAASPAAAAEPEPATPFREGLRRGLGRAARRAPSPSSCSCR